MGSCLVLHGLSKAVQHEVIRWEAVKLHTVKLMLRFLLVPLH